MIKRSGKIVKIMFCLGSMSKGGAERVVANLSNYLIDKHKVSIVVTVPNDSAYPLNDKIKLISLDKNGENRGNILKRSYRRIMRLRKTIKKIEPDVIVSLLPEPTYRLIIANSFIKNKVIISVRNDPKVEYNTFLKKLIMKILYSRADGYIFQTDEARDFFSKNIRNRSVVIPNPINDDFIVRPFNGERVKKIVTVGRLVSQKNQKNLISAYNELLKKYNDYDLYIYGDGELKDALVNQCDNLQISDKVHFEGNVDNLKERIYDAKMFVLASDYEGMPNALMEAMSLGIPCISTDCPCGGPRFLIKNNENGLLVPVNDIKALTDSMLYIIENNDSASKFSQNANKIGKELCSKRINKKWLDYIKKIVSGE